MSRSLSWAVGALVGILVGVVAFVVSPEGLAIHQRDAPTYLSAAENIAAGRGFRASFGAPGLPIDFSAGVSPVVHFPPGYSSLLALGVAVGVDSFTAAHVLSAILLGAISLVTFGFARVQGFGWPGSIFASLIAAVVSSSVALLAQSDLLYGLLLLSALALSVRFLRTRMPRYLVGAILLAAATVAVRFVGLALVATVAVVGLVSASRYRDRLLRAGSAAAAGLGVFFALLSGSRSLAWHPPTLVDVKIAANAVTGWVVPPIGTPTLRVLIFGLICLAALGWIISAPTRGGAPGSGARVADSRVALVVGLYAPFHILAVLGAMTFFDAQVIPDWRILYPVLVSLLVVAMAWLGSPVNGSLRRRRISRVLIILGFAVFVSQTWLGAVFASGLVDDEIGFTSPSFVESPAVLEATSLLQDGSLVFSNVPDGLWVAGGEGAFSIPRLWDPWSLERSSDLSVELSRIERLVESHQAYILWHHAHERPYLVPEAELRELAQCVLTDDGNAVLLADEENPRCTS